MKILFSPCHYSYDDHFIGSEQSWSFNIANKISEIYPDSVVITGFKRLLKEKKYRIIELQRDKKSIDMSIRNSIIFNILYTREINKLLKKEKFDLVHHVLPFGINRTFNLSKFKNIPLVIGPIQSELTFKDNDIKSKNVKFFKINLILYNTLLPLLKYLIKPLSKKTLKKASKLIVINDFTKKILINEGIEPKKIVIIPPGIDIKKFNYIPFNKKNSKVIELITVSYLIKRKGIDLILKALKEVLKKDKNVRLRILGDGPQKESLSKLVKELKLENNVIFDGYIPNNRVGDYYKNAHIFVSMSKSESYGTVCLEAMSSGLPIISSKVGGFSDAIKEDFNGFLVEQEDYNALADRIIKLIKNKKLIEIYGKNSRIKAEKEYDWDSVIIPQYLKVYRNVLKK